MTTSTRHEWSYPGARWWKFDFHTHSPASADYGWKGNDQHSLRQITRKTGFYSPGSIPNSMSVDDLVHIQSSRNETVASLLARVPVPDHSWLTTDRTTLMDRRGEGEQIDEMD